MASWTWLKRSRPYGNSPLNYLSSRAIFPVERKSDQLLRQRVHLAQDLHWRDLKGHYGCVNAIEFSNGLGQHIASGGDDRRVLLWNVEKALSDIGSPHAMTGEHNSNIFCTAFDRENTCIFSGGNDEQVIVHDMKTGQTKDVFMHEDAVYGLSTDPSNPHVFASACDDGRILIYDVRESTAEPFCLANYASSMHSVVYNPIEPRLLATANAKEGVGLWDVRKPRSCVLRYGGSFIQQSCMSVRFNRRGDQVIALRRRLPPVLYGIHSHQPICEFDHSGYYNSCTMKSICFAGDNDQYVLSGSDEFNLYMWAIPEDLSERAYINSAHMVLKGHRSIVNQVRFNPANHLVMSSGVEKIIKIWSPFRLPSKDSTTKDLFNSDRPVYTHEEYINLVLQDGHVMSHDYSQESMDEDPRMMAFFDSLVQRELEGWSSDDELSSSEEEMYSRIVQLSPSDTVSNDASDNDAHADTDEDSLFSPFTIAFASVMANQASEGNDRYPRLNSALARAEASNERASNSEQSLTTERELSNRNERLNVGQRANSARKQISKLVMKKKMELRGLETRSRKRSHNVVLSSSDSSDVESEGHIFKSEGHISVKCQSNRKKNRSRKNKFHITSPSDTNMPGCSTQADSRSRHSEKSEAEKMQSQQKWQKLKRFRALRNSILNSDSEISDLETKNEKQPKYSTVSKSTNVNNSEKVAFKNGKKKEGKVECHTCSDYGPYLNEMVNPLPEPSNGSDINQSLHTMSSPTGPSTSQTDLTVYTSVCEKINSDMQERRKSATSCEFKPTESRNKHKRKNSLRDFCTSIRMVEDCDLSSNSVVNDNSAGPNSSPHEYDTHTCRRHRDISEEVEEQTCVCKKPESSTNYKTYECVENVIEENEFQNTDTLETQNSELNLQQPEGIVLDRRESHSESISDKASCDVEKLDSRVGQSTLKVEPPCSNLPVMDNINCDIDSDVAKMAADCVNVPTTSGDGNTGDIDVNCAEPPADIAASTSTNVNNADPHPTWTEFKMFKNRMERARRHYRKHKKHPNRYPSDDDDA